MKHLGLIAVVAAGLLLTLPVLTYGFPQIADDTVYHVAWYRHFAEQVLAGDLYPRWLSGMNGGFGSPVFFFYPPAPYYLTALFRPLLADDPDGWRQLGLSASAALVASGLTAYLWLKDSAGRGAAAAGAVAYMAAPYHLAVDLYTRAAFAELWAFAWLPLVLYFARRIAHGRGRAVAGLAAAYALLVATHLPTVIVFSALPAAYACLLAGAGRRARAAALTLAGMALGAGLSAIYLLPALTTQEYVSINQMRSGDYHYGNWFLFTGTGWWGTFEARLGWMVLTVLCAATGAYAFTRASARRQAEGEGAFWAAAAWLSLFMMTPPGRFVWRLVPVLQTIQFPWRFNVVLTVAASALAALAVSSADPARRGLNRLAGAAACSVAAVWVLAAAYGAWTAYPRDDPRLLEAAARLRAYLSLAPDAPEYRPRSVPSAREEDLRRLLHKVGASDAGPVKFRIVEGAGRAEVVRWEPRDIALSVDAPAGATLEVSQFYYPMWEASVEGGPCCLAVRPSAPDGLLSVGVPPGPPRRVLLRLGRAAPEYAGQIASAVSCVVLLSLLVAGRMRKGTRPPA